MFPARITTGAFILEGLNSISTTYYFYYVFFFLRDHFGFGSRENLLWATGQGLVYVFAAWQGGRFGQRRGYLRAMRLGFAGMSVCFIAGWLIHHAGPPRSVEITLQVILMLLATLSICFTWPSLEAIVSEGQPGARLQWSLGVYNLIWSGTAAFAYFTGGALIEMLGGPQQILLVPGLMIAGQWAFVRWLERKCPDGARPSPTATVHAAIAPPSERLRSPVPPRTFLLMSWLANPCAYVAISAAIPLIPTLAERLGLSPRAAGFFCSVWLFARSLTFVALWRWTGWHYRFRWLAAAFLGTIGGFLCIFVSSHWAGLGREEVLAVVTIAQVVFGISLGLIYYSSLFYSMDVGDTKGDHGGIHEAAIGAGILGGPLVAAAAQFARPNSPTAAAWAVSGTLGLGLAVITWMRWRGSRGR